MVELEEAVSDPVLRFETPYGEMKYDRWSRTTFSPLVSEPVQLTHTEAVILETLMTQPESTVTYNELASSLWVLQLGHLFFMLLQFSLWL